MLLIGRRVAGVVLALILTGHTSAQSCDWEWVNPSPPRADIFRLTFEADTFVGVGAAGTIIRSSDGFKWNLIPSGVDGDLFGVDRGVGFFVAVGDGAIIRSPTGEQWDVVFEDDDVSLVDVEYNAFRFVAVGAGLDGNVLTSTYGLEWYLAEVPWSGPADSIGRTDDGFVVAVGREIWFSPDGFVWKLEDLVPASMAFQHGSSNVKRSGSDLFELDRIDLGWTGSRLLWAGGRELWSREDIGSWELVAHLDGCEPFSDWLGLAAGPGWAIASGISGCPTPYLDPKVSIVISTDGGLSFRDPWETELGGFPALARYGSRWVVAGSLGDVMTSANGTDWDCPAGGCTSLACSDGFVDLVRGGDSWVAVGGAGICDADLKRRSGGTAARSVDGIHWELSEPVVGRLRGVTSTASGFVAVGDGWIATSANGVGWESEASPDDVELRSVAANDSWIVAVGPGGAIYASEDADTWLKPFLYVTSNLDHVRWVGDRFLVLGRDGTILRSFDSVNWSDALTAATTDLNGVAGGPDTMIVVGSEGVVLASSDGEIWTPRRSGVEASLRDVAWGNDRFVAVGWEDRADGSRPAVVLASATGDRWTSFSPPGEAFESIRWTGDSWLVVGGDRTILRTECLGELVEFHDDHIQIPLGETVEVGVSLSDVVEADTTIEVVSSSPLDVVVPDSVTIPAGSDTVFVPVTGASVVSSGEVEVILPEFLGGGSTTAQVTVQPPQWTPRRPSGRVSP